MIYDFKKQEKNLYGPGNEPVQIDVPEMVFLQVDGRGDPNDPEGEYSSAVEVLYALSYAIRMMPRNGHTPDGYFEYVVPPLEGLWWFTENQEKGVVNKAKFAWTMMIRQPEFVTEDVFRTACKIVAKKKPHLDLSKARLVRYLEGPCVQCMHAGPFDEEPETLARMNGFMKENGLISDLSDTRKHHEIYLTDPRKTEASKMRTILRYPVRKE